MVDIAKTTGRKVIGPNTNKQLVSITGVTTPANNAPGSTKAPKGMLDVFRPNVTAKVDPSIARSNTNKAILKGQGLDLDTILTPREKRKKRAGLRGEVEELNTLLGE